MKAEKLPLACTICSVFIVIGLLFTACGKEGSSDIEQKTDKESPVVTQTTPKTQDNEKEYLQRDPNYLTSIEAAQLAYEKAREWSSDAVFKSMTIGTDLGLHYAWSETDMSYSWSVNFVSPEKKQYLIVYVNYGKVHDTHVSDDNLKNMPLEGHPVNGPLISLKEAFAAALDGGAISGLTPVNVDYNTYGYNDRDFPYWVIVYRVPLTSETDEKHFYYINANTGELSEKVYKNDENDIISEDELQVKGRDLSGLAHMEDQRHMVIKFLTLINEGNADAA
ncbi:MAG: PepSY domain-containing protein, partial [Clostridia bacterium]|nr:PepSY domain-containing protein [Clostridia bacterium]